MTCRAAHRLRPAGLHTSTAEREFSDLIRVLTARTVAKDRSVAVLESPAMSPRRTRGPVRAASLLLLISIAAGATIDLCLVSTHAQEASDAEVARAHYRRGALLEQRHDLTGAAAAYRAAIERDGTMATAYDRLGFVLGLQGRTA